MGFPRQPALSGRKGEQFETLEPRRLMTRAMGIDVSDWQGTIDWNLVAGSGVQFAFIRASRGGTTGTYDESAGTGTLSQRYDDPNLDTNVAGAQAAGLEVGVYHFARADILTNTGADEAQHFLDDASAYMGSGFLPPVLDLEAGSARSKTDLTQWAVDFSTTIFNATGVFPIVYVNSTYANNEVDSTLADLPLWIARPAGATNPATGNPPAAAGLPNVYGVWNPSYPQLPIPQPWAFWQYSSTGHVNGIAGNVDLDVFNGTLDELRFNYVQGYPIPTDPAVAVQVTLGSQVVTDGDTKDFGTVILNGLSPTMTFTVTNVSNDIVYLSGPYLLDVNGQATQFPTPDMLVPQLLPGQSDTFSVQLLTNHAGAQSDTLTFYLGGAAYTSFSVNLTGTVAPVASGAVSGVLFDDVNGDGIREAGENGLAGWTVWADVDGDGIYNSVVDYTTTTSDSGEYVFNNLTPSTVTGKAVTIYPDFSTQPGWYQTSPAPGNPVSISVIPGAATRAKAFGVAHLSQLSGHLFLDANKDGVKNGGDTPLSNWLVFIDLNNNGVLDPFENVSGNTATTDANGLYQFTNLHAASYVVIRAVPNSNYTFTNTSYYATNIFSNSDIQDEDFGFRLA